MGGITQGVFDKSEHVINDLSSLMTDNSLVFFRQIDLLGTWVSLVFFMSTVSGCCNGESPDEGLADTLKWENFRYG